MAERRPFACDGESWVAWPSGGGAYGTGVYGPGNIDAVHFGRADAPETPVFEAVLAAGRFEDLFDSELVDLFRTARRVVDKSSMPDRPVSRRSLSG